MFTAAFFVLCLPVLLALCWLLFTAAGVALAGAVLPLFVVADKTGQQMDKLHPAAQIIIMAIAAALIVAILGNL